MIPLLATALLISATPALDEGQGTAEPLTHVRDLSPGQVVYGPSFHPATALGKVVLVEFGGS